MAKKIIILERVDKAGESPTYKYVLWAIVPEAFQTYYADEDFESAYADVSNDDLAALRSGAVVEQVGTEKVYSLTATAEELLAELSSPLRAHLNQLQTRVNSFNPHDNYGKYYDGTTWVIPTDE